MPPADGDEMEPTTRPTVDEMRAEALVCNIGKCGDFDPEAGAPCRERTIDYTVWCNGCITAAYIAALEAQLSSSRETVEQVTKEKDRWIAEVDAVFHAAMRALDGEPMSDFEQSFPLVRRAAEVAEHAKHREAFADRMIAAEDKLIGLSSELSQVREDRDRLAKALESVTKDMDRAGGDGYGMPECPWCRCQYDDLGEPGHRSECELVAARAALSAGPAPQGGGRNG